MSSQKITWNLIDCSYIYKELYLSAYLSYWFGSTDEKNAAKLMLSSQL